MHDDNRKRLCKRVHSSYDSGSHDYCTQADLSRIVGVDWTKNNACQDYDRLLLMVSHRRGRGAEGGNRPADHEGPAGHEEVFHRHANGLNLVCTRSYADGPGYGDGADCLSSPDCENLPDWVGLDFDSSSFGSV